MRRKFLISVPAFSLLTLFSHIFFKDILCLIFHVKPMKHIDKFFFFMTDIMNNSPFLLP